MSTDPQVVAERFARERRAPGRPLDFTMASLRNDVDRILSSTAVLSREGTGQAVVESGLAAYVGETLARLFDGRWKGQFRDDNPGPNFYLSWVAFGSYRFFPSHFIGYRLADGATKRTFAEYLDSVLPAILMRTGSTKEAGAD